MELGLGHFQRMSNKSYIFIDVCFTYLTDIMFKNKMVVNCLLFAQSLVNRSVRDCGKRHILPDLPGSVVKINLVCAHVHVFMWVHVLEHASAIVSNCECMHMYKSVYLCFCIYPCVFIIVFTFLIFHPISAYNLLEIITFHF